MKKIEQIEDLFNDDEELSGNSDLMKKVLEKTRKATARKDAMDLVFVKIWAAMAVLLAPLFAKGMQKHAKMSVRPTAVKNKTTATSTNTINTTTKQEAASSVANSFGSNAGSST